MKKKIIISGPLLSRSGYGEMARFALKALSQRQDSYDLFINITNWGSTGNISLNNQFIDYIYGLAFKTEENKRINNNNPIYDISLQITIPSEWKKIAKYNIGYTAGIETNLISPSWFSPSMQMDKIIVISEHAKYSFLNTVFNDTQGSVHKVTTPIDVCHFPVKNIDKKQLDLNLKHDFNFLAVCQWGPRKNLEQTITNFIEEFINENVGLVLKINTVNDSIMDREICYERISKLLSAFPNKKCSVYILHGLLSEEEVNYLYNHPNIKAIVSSTHGEGFGYPLFEAAYNELPIVATDWSGHLDFLTMKDEQGKDKKMFAKVDYELKPIAQEHVWPGILEQGTSWAHPSSSSFKSKMREVYKDYARFKSWAKKLNSWVRNEFSEEKMYDKFINSVGFTRPKKNLNIQNINNISFCIPTNGKRKEKTLLTINSIKKQNWNIPYEIILCGDIEKFKDTPGVILLDKKEEAHTRKVSVLRNTAADKAQYENIVFCDDDVILSQDWLDKTMQFSSEKPWEVLSNKVLSPDGTRYWDRCTLIPHNLVDYDADETTPNLYQSSAFFMVRKYVFEKVRWNEDRYAFSAASGPSEQEVPYHHKPNDVGEDVQYSYDLANNFYLLSFNKNALVWHNDDTYTEFNNLTLKKEIIKEKTGITFFPFNAEEYDNLVEIL